MPSRPTSSIVTTTTTTSVPVATTPTVLAPAPALGSYLTTLGHVVAHTGVVGAGTSAVAIAARQLSTDAAEVDVLVWTGTAWKLDSTLALPPPTFPPADLPIQADDVTGDGRPDFLVRVIAGDNEPGTVVSDDGGTWRLVPVVTPGAPDAIYAGRNPSFANGHLTTQYDDCTPNCAEGTMTTVVWAYDKATRKFVTASH